MTAGAGVAGRPEPPWWPPEVPPAPGPPEPGRPPPHPTVYPPAPVVYDNVPVPGTDLRERLLERRIVLANGRLDVAVATDVAARLMYLDGSGDGVIELRWSCPDGELDAAVMLADTVELLGVELRATATGVVGGPASLPFAVATRRIAHPHVTFRLSEAESEMRGRASDLVAAAARHAQLVATVHQRMARATGRSEEAIAADFAARRLLDAEQARDYGLVDETTSPSPRPRTS